MWFQALFASARVTGDTGTTGPALAASRRGRNGIVDRRRDKLNSNTLPHDARLPDDDVLHVLHGLLLHDDNTTPGDTRPLDVERAAIGTNPICVALDGDAGAEQQGENSDFEFHSEPLSGGSTGMDSLDSTTIDTSACEPFSLGVTIRPTPSI